MFKYAFTVLVVFAAAAPASAGTVTYLSRTGSGTTCSLAVPCASMSSAVTAAGVNGEVICLDHGNYGGLTITQSVMISCGDGLWENPGGGVGVAISGNSNVVIEGLVVDGLGMGATIMTMGGQGGLSLRRVRIGNATGSGLVFSPNGSSTLQIADLVFYGLGQAGIYIGPTGSGGARVMIERTQLDTNGAGIWADATGTTGTVAVQVRDSIVSNSTTTGVQAVSTTGKGMASITMDRSSSLLSGTYGVLANGPTSYVILNTSTVMSNQTGVNPTGGGYVITYQNNALTGNVVDGATNLPIFLK